MKASKYFLIMTTLCSLLWSSCTSVSLEPVAAKKFADSFDAPPQKDSPWHFEVYSKERAEYIEQEGADGGKALKLTVAPNEIISDGSRSEIVMKNSDRLGQETWYSWRFMIPENYIDDDENRLQIIAQWRDQPDASRGEKKADYPTNSPMISLVYGVLRGNQSVSLYYGLKEENMLVDFTEIEKGTWYQVTMHLFTSIGPNGFIEAWIGDEALTPYNGQDNKYYGRNMYNRAPATLRLGLHRDADIDTTNSIIIDDFYLGPDRESVVLQE